MRKIPVNREKSDTHLLFIKATTLERREQFVLENQLILIAEQTKSF
jgi:hypothetical protein